MKTIRNQNNKEFIAKKTKKQKWGIQNSQLPRNNNKKINDMRGKKGGEELGIGLPLKKLNNKKKWGAWIYPAPSK